MDVRLISQKTDGMADAQFPGVIFHVRPQMPVPQKVQAAVGVGFQELCKGLQQSCVIFLLVKPADVQQGNGVPQPIVRFRNAPAEIHAVENHGNAVKAIEFRHRPLNLRAERHRHGPAPVIVKPVENGLGSPLRLHLRHIVHRVDAGNAPRQSCRHYRVQNHIQVGVDHIRAFLPENLRELRHHGHIQPRLFA